MKKFIAVMLIAAVAMVSVFALDLSFGVDFMHNFDATATATISLGRLEVGGGLYTNAVSKIVAFIMDGADPAAVKDKVIDAFKTAEYGAMAVGYVDIIDSDLKLAVGGIADVGSISAVKEKLEDKHICFNFLASAKATYYLGDIAAFAQVGVPMATVDFSDAEAPFKWIINPGEAQTDTLIQYIKDNARISVGATLAL